ncbi:MAG TPA: hypothetical protein DDY86_03070 [Syntrophaceae bacterium]|nr:hypothetical protein [Syntrophaceae bacterium]
MANLNLQALIDQVLGITREAWDMKKRKLDEGLSGHEQTQLRNNKIDDELLKQRGAQELQEQGNEASLARQGLVNTGALEQAKERTAGEIARQGLANEGTRYTADQGLQGHMYTADTNYAMKRDELAKGYDPELIKAHAAVIANVNSSPEAVASSQAAIDFYTQNAMKKQQQARQGLAGEQPAAAIPAASPAAATRPSLSLNDLVEPVGGAIEQGIIGKNAPTDFNDFRISKPAAPAQAAQPIDFTGLSPEQLSAAQKDWQVKNPGATVAGDSPAIIARQQFAKKRKEEELAAGKAYNESLVKKNADWMSKRDERRKANAAWLGN